MAAVGVLKENSEQTFPSFPFLPSENFSALYIPVFKGKPVVEGQVGPINEAEYGGIRLPHHIWNSTREMVIF